MATYIGLDLGGTNIKISVFDEAHPHRGSFRLGARPQSHL